MHFCIDSRYTSSKPLLIISNKFYLSSARRRFLLQKFTLECKLFMIYTIRSFVVLNWQLLWANFRLVSSVCRCKVSMLFTEVDYSKEKEKKLETKGVKKKFSRQKTTILFKVPLTKDSQLFSRIISSQLF